MRPVSFQSFDSGTNDEGDNGVDNTGINPFGNNNGVDNTAFTIRSVSFPSFEHDDTSEFFQSSGRAVKDDTTNDGPCSSIDLFVSECDGLFGTSSFRSYLMDQVRVEASLILFYSHAFAAYCLDFVLFD